MGSVEVIAPSDYMIRPPQPPAFLFLIDVSLPAVASGLVDAACEGIGEAIRRDRLPGDSRTMVGIVTYDSSAHFYALKAQHTRPQVFVVPQVEDMFLPLSEDLFVPLQECKEAVLSTLAALPDIWRSTGCTDNCMVSPVLLVYWMEMRFSEQFTGIFAFVLDGMFLIRLLCLLA